jgi:hypothetical protein
MLRTVAESLHPYVLGPMIRGVAEKNLAWVGGRTETHVCGE